MCSLHWTGRTNEKKFRKRPFTETRSAVRVRSRGENPAQPSRRGCPEKMERKTILVVDDSPVVLELTGSALEGAGYKVVLRSRGEGTVAAVLQERPDLVLLDVNMPRLSGD